MNNQAGLLPGTPDLLGLAALPRSTRRVSTSRRAFLAHGGTQALLFSRAVGISTDPFFGTRTRGRD